MPATAHQPESEGEPTLAPVVSLAGRLGQKAKMAEPTVPDDVQDDELLERARRYWGRVFAQANVNLMAPETAAVIQVVTKELERLVGGLLVIREGRGDSLPANPGAGVDLTSAVEISSVLRDLAHAAQAAQEK